MHATLARHQASTDLWHKHKTYDWHKDTTSHQAPYTQHLKLDPGLQPECSHDVTFFLVHCVITSPSASQHNALCNNKLSDIFCNIVTDNQQPIMTTPMRKVTRCTCCVLNLSKNTPFICLHYDQHTHNWGLYLYTYNTEHWPMLCNDTHQNAKHIDISNHCTRSKHCMFERLYWQIIWSRNDKQTATQTEQAVSKGSWVRLVSPKSGFGTPVYQSALMCEATEAMTSTQLGTSLISYEDHTWTQRHGIVASMHSHKVPLSAAIYCRYAGPWHSRHNSARRCDKQHWGCLHWGLQYAQQTKHEPQLTVM